MMGSQHEIYTDKQPCKRQWPKKLYTSKMMSETDFTSTGLQDPESPCQDRVSLEPGPKSTGHSADRKDFLSNTIPATPHNHRHAL